MKIETDAHYFGTRRSARDLEEAVAEMLDRERESTGTAVAVTWSEESRTGGASGDSQGEALIRRAIRSGIESELYCRYRDLAAYEASHPNLAAELIGDYGHDPGWDLIRARISAGLRQVDLAKELSIAEEDLLRLEANRYADASLELLQQIARALRTQIRIVQTVA